MRPLTFAFTILLFQGLLFQGITPPIYAQQTQEPVAATAAVGEVACLHFFGFGAEWDSAGHTYNHVTDEDMKIMKRRVAWMRLPVARVMMQAQWCYRGEGKYDFNSSDMQNLYRLLDVLQGQGTRVILTDWGVGLDWLRAEGIRDAVDPQYARVIAAYLDHLLNEKGYHCIDAFVLGNEPDLEIRDYEFWKKALHQLVGELENSGLTDQITLAGPGQTQITLRDDWYRPAVKELDEVFGVYTAHTYPLYELVRSGKLEAKLRDFREGPYQDLPDLDRKPLIITESGVIGFESSNHAHNSVIANPEYGLDMADLAIQAVASGVDGVLGWMLDDNSHQEFAWGMWDNKKNGLQLRPWFYSWALLCRFVPAEAITYRVTGLPKGVRGIAAEIPSQQAKQRSDWTLCLVNRTDTTTVVHIQAPYKQPMTLNRFVYKLAENRTDTDGMPVAISSEKEGLAGDLIIECAPNSFSVVTSL